MTTLVTGAGGFIGGHLVDGLLLSGISVRATDVRPVTEWEQVHERARNYGGYDLRDPASAGFLMAGVSDVYALAADMGGMGYLTFNEAEVITSNLLISVNTANAAWRAGVGKFTYASSACVYPEYRQEAPDVPALAEDDALPAQPDLAYGWEKLVTERLLAAYHAEGRMDVRIARLHNIYGPMGTFDGGREKAPAALCRKAAETPDGGVIDVWGDGNQTRSFCWIDDCVTGLMRLAASGYPHPLNIGSSQLVNISYLTDLAIAASGKTLSKRYIPGPQGVRGRNSDNTRCLQVLGWEPSVTLEDGIGRLYPWVEAQLKARVPA